MSKRVYYVKAKTGGQLLVRAHTPAGAIRRAAIGHFTAEVARQETLIELLKKGHEVLECDPEQIELIDPDFREVEQASDG